MVVHLHLLLVRAQEGEVADSGQGAQHRSPGRQINANGTAEEKPSSA